MSMKSVVLAVIGTVCFSTGIVTLANSSPDLSRAELREISAGDGAVIGFCMTVSRPGTCGCYNNAPPGTGGEDYWQCGLTNNPNKFCYYPVIFICFPFGPTTCTNVPTCITDSNCELVRCFYEMLCSGSSGNCL